MEGVSLYQDVLDLIELIEGTFNTFRPIYVKTYGLKFPYSMQVLCENHFTFHDFRAIDRCSSNVYVLLKPFSYHLWVRI